MTAQTSAPTWGFRSDEGFTPHAGSSSLQWSHAFLPMHSVIQSRQITVAALLLQSICARTSDTQVGAERVITVKYTILPNQEYLMLAVNASVWTWPYDPSLPAWTVLT